MSGLHEGIINSNSYFFFAILKPKLFKIFIISLSLILKPAIFSNKDVLNIILLFISFFIFWTSNLLIFPPQISVISSAAFVNPNSIDFGSIPLSNLNFASVSKFNIFDVFLIDLGLK